MLKPRLLIISILVLFYPTFTWAQLSHFVYLQTEARLPFYAKLDKKVFSSSATGHLILPKLPNGEFTIAIGFPNSDILEQTFVCTIQNADAGFLIKDFGEKGWGLFNLQTLGVSMTATKKANSEPGVTEKSDEFSNMLAQVVNDPSIKQVETNIVLPNNDSNNQIPNEPIQTVSNISLSIKQITHSTDTNGWQAAYIANEGSQLDTINVLIQLDSITDIGQPQLNVTVDTSKVDAAFITEIKNTEIVNSATQLTDSTVVEPKQMRSMEDDRANNKFLEIEVTPTDSINSEKKPIESLQLINSNCKENATEEDFLKLRKKMAGENSGDAMIAVAKKMFKSRCFTTEQIKNLSVLFLTDEGKYQFFDVAYQSVSDTPNFITLESQLSDTYFINRFKVMVRQL